MTIEIDRRLMLSGLLATPLLASPLAAFAQAAAPITGDVVLGNPDAPLTIIEYASFTCPHCASFHINTWPKFEEEYVDTGKVKFIMREVYFDKYGLWASMTARCGGEKGFYPMVDTFLKQQSTWTKADDISQAIQQVGRRAGLSQDQLNACLGDRDFAKTLLEAYQKNAAEDEVRSTPTFIIGGELHSGSMSFEDFSAIVDAAL
jgi:protein-disulfide isomerase